MNIILDAFDLDVPEASRILHETMASTSGRRPRMITALDERGHEDLDRVDGPRVQE
jgi:hypothetical protein